MGGMQKWKRSRIRSVISIRWSIARGQLGAVLETSEHAERSRRMCAWLISAGIVLLWRDPDVCRHTRGCVIYTAHNLMGIRLLSEHMQVNISVRL